MRPPLLLSLATLPAGHGATRDRCEGRWAGTDGQSAQLVEVDRSARGLLGGESRTTCRPCISPRLAAARAWLRQMQREIGSGARLRPLLSRCPTSPRSPNRRPANPPASTCRLAYNSQLTLRACSSHSSVVRKSIARVLTVINQKTRANLRELYKNKKLPLDMRKKQTRAIRRRLTKVRATSRTRDVVHSRLTLGLVSLAPCSTSAPRPLSALTRRRSTSRSATSSSRPKRAWLHLRCCVWPRASLA